MQISKNRRRELCVNGSICTCKIYTNFKEYLKKTCLKKHHPENPSSWVCTRYKGHTGVHVACNSDTHNLVSWRKDETLKE